MKRTQVDEKYKWDFTNLYQDIDVWKADLKKMVDLTDEIAKLKGHLHEKESFLKSLDLNKEVNNIAQKLIVYTHLGDVDQTNTVYQELQGLMMNEVQKISIKTAFIEPELKTVGKEKVLGFLTDENYQQYRLGYELFFEQAEHVLSEHDEELLSKVSLSRGAIGSLYDNLAFADNKEVTIEWKGKVQPLTESLILEIYEDSDPVADQLKRLEANRLRVKNFSDHKHSFAKIYEGILQGETESIGLRNYPTALEASLAGDSVPKDVYLKLLEVGKKYTKPFEDFILVLKEQFKLDKFYPTDNSLKIVSEYKRTFNVEEAKEIIEQALSILGDEYLKNLEVAWSDNRIDYYEDTNKTSGAYSTGGNGIDPIILMNWDNKLNSVNTLAHEIGHSVHTIFADNSQPQPLNNYPIILAEVASTLNEHILFDYMYKNSTSIDEKIYLLQQRIHTIISTFYRQIEFASFEYRAHDLVQKGIPLTADSLTDLFSENRLDYGYKVYDKYESAEKVYGWPRVSHFFHSPYYVYKYAIDITASYKLYNDIKKGNVQSAINFLKAGGSKRPLDVMLDSGIDFNKEETYLPLIQAIEDYVEELKGLLKQKNN